MAANAAVQIQHPPSLEQHGNSEYLLRVVIFQVHFLSLDDVAPQIAQPQQKLSVLSVKVE